MEKRRLDRPGELAEASLEGGALWGKVNSSGHLEHFETDFFQMAYFLSWGPSRVPIMTNGTPRDPSAPLGATRHCVKMRQFVKMANFGRRDPRFWLNAYF